MNYKRMLEKQPPDKTGIVEDGTEVTYRQLLDMAEQKRAEIEKKGIEEGIPQRDYGISRKLYFIEEDTIIGELTAFIACQGSSLVPVILADNVTDREKEQLERIEVPEEAVMAVLTSGTTGPHKILFRTYESWADFFPYQNQVFSMNGDTVLFAQGSLAFTGNMNLYMALFSVGGTVVATRKFEPRYWYSMIRKYQTDYIYLIPAKMMALCRVVKEPCPEVKHFVTGSQSFGRRELQRTRMCFPEISVVLYYGSSEANYITYLTDQEMVEDSRLVGRAFPQVQVSIQNGVFYVDSEYGIIGMEHPFCTKDMGSADKEGRFYFEGRQDDLLNVNGRKCRAYKIERAIWEKLGVINIVAADRGKDRDILTAYYERKEAFPSTLQIRRLLQDCLEDWEIPKQFIRVDKLPTTASGKLTRGQDISAKLRQREP